MLGMGQLGHPILACWHNWVIVSQHFLLQMKLVTNDSRLGKIEMYSPIQLL